MKLPTLGYSVRGISNRWNFCAAAWLALAACAQSDGAGLKVPVSPLADALQYMGPGARETNYTFWCVAPILDDAGKVHLFCARWPEANVDPAWRKSSEIAHYVGDRPEGPFVFSDVAVKGSGVEGAWDRYTAHNSEINRFGDTYALLYISNSDYHQPPHPLNQKVGMVTSRSLYGPWTKAGKDGLILDNQKGHFSEGRQVVNPTLLKVGDKFHLYYKTATQQGGKWRTVFGLAIAERLEGPYVHQPDPVTAEGVVIEDASAFLWDGKVCLLTTDNHGLVTGLEGALALWVSEDGIHFKPEWTQLGMRLFPDYLPAYDPSKITRVYGNKPKAERPKVLVVDGKPAWLYVASGWIYDGWPRCETHVFKINLPDAAGPLPEAAGRTKPAGEPGQSKRSRVGLNLSGIRDWNTELPFADLAKMCRPWVSQREGAAWGRGPELELDERGWVRRLEAGCYAEIPFFTFEKGHAPAGDYVCLYDGRGRIEFHGGPRVVEERSGRIVLRVDPGAGGFWLQLRETDPQDPVRGVRLLLPGAEAAHERQPFNPAFLTRWAPMNTLRFMDWMETNGSRQERWTDRPRVDDANWSGRGVPVEIMVDLCNRQKANAWFCMPHRADDDYIRHFAEYVRDRLDPSLKVYVEYSNEIWNSIFKQTRYCEQRGRELGLAEKPWEAGWRYSAQRSIEIFAIWEEAFGGRERLVRVMATQAANPYIAGVKLAHGDAAGHCDALAIAPYMSFNVALNGQPSAAEVAGWTVDQVVDHLEQVSLPQCLDWMRAHQDIARRHGLALIAYEAGQHAVGVGGAENDEALTRILTAANRHPPMEQLYTRYLDAWAEAGGGLVCLFASTSAWSKWGSWGLLEYADDPPDRPKFRAAMDWLRPAALR